MPSGAAQAAGALRALLRTPVAEIDLSQCGLSGSDGELFADALGGARALARLDLSGNAFGDEGAPRLKAPPPLPYKVDTSRPSLRTNWTRLVSGVGGGRRPRCSSCTRRARA